MASDNYNLKEQWKYTNINNFKNFEFDFLSKGKKIINQSHDIHIKNNNFIISKKLDDAIIIKDLKNVIKNNDFEIRNLLNKTYPTDLNPFIKANKQNYINGIFLHIKDDSNLNKPIKIKYDMDENKKKSFLNTRIFISIGKNVSGKIRIDDKMNNICYLNTLFEIFLNENSNMDIIHLSEKSKTTQIYNFLCSINKNSTLNLSPVDISGKLIKKNYFISLIGQNSNIYYNSLNLLNDKNHIDNFINIDHLSDHTYSSTKHKNILSGRSKSVFYSKAIINADSFNSEAIQKNNNLMISDKATVHSNPQLEIYNNDVKCSHGSTTGEIDDELLFYMQTRGLNKIDCKKIILHGFANEIIKELNSNRFKNKIQGKIKEWLYCAS